MKKIILLFFVLLLTACSDSNEKATWVAQNIPNEQKQPDPIYPAKVEVYSPNVTTTGQVIKQKEREKWILVNAQDVAGHPYALVGKEFLTLGEVEAIDVAHNIAVIHIRNSYDFDIVEPSSFVTTKNGQRVTASVDQIETLLAEAMEKRVDWQVRHEKNQKLLEGVEPTELENFTTYYSKNIFTFNSDELMDSAVKLIEALNQAIETQNFEELNEMINSDDVKEEIQFVKKPVSGFTIKEAKRDGVYYFVNGVDENKEEVRLTFILEQQTYQLIGANLINADNLKKEKIATVDVTSQKNWSDAPALEMFANKQIETIKIQTADLTWQLEYKDSKIAVKKDGKDSYNCTDVQIQENKFTLIGCGPQMATVPLVKLQ
ncbi:MAG: hypothetical protein ABS942_13645 [Solibacillus sp.]|uniref:hypothetical protein n=1 Tax=unclassified Solibacillus TaxID=2637870 RepID=UPI003101B02A